MKKYIKNITIWYLIYSIVLFSSPTFALGAGGWNVISVVRSGSQTTYNAVRQTVNGLVTSSAVLVPPLSAVVRSLAGGLTAVAVVYAIDQLTQGASWLYDESTKSVKYTTVASSDPSKTSPVLYFSPFLGTCFDVSTCHAKAPNATSCSVVSTFNSPNTMRCVYPNSAVDDFFPQQNPNYNPNYVPPPPTEHTITQDQIASKVLQNANANHQPSVDYIGSVADSTYDDDLNKRYVPQSTVLNQLNQNAVYPSNTQSSSTTLTSSTQSNASSVPISQSETKTELPIFCAYATALCDWIGWTKELPPDEPNSVVDIKTNDINFNQNTYINPNNSCPSPTSISFGSWNVPIDYSMFCNVLLILRPAVISVSLITAIYIVSGVRDNG